MLKKSLRIFVIFSCCAIGISNHVFAYPGMCTELGANVGGSCNINSKISGVYYTTSLDYSSNSYLISISGQFQNCRNSAGEMQCTCVTQQTGPGLTGTRNGKTINLANINCPDFQSPVGPMLVAMCKIIDNMSCTDNSEYNADPYCRDATPTKPTFYQYGTTAWNTFDRNNNRVCGTSCEGRSVTKCSYNGAGGYTYSSYWIYRCTNLGDSSLYSNTTNERGIVNGSKVTPPTCTLCPGIINSAGTCIRGKTPAPLGLYLKSECKLPATNTFKDEAGTWTYGGECAATGAGNEC